MIDWIWKIVLVLVMIFGWYRSCQPVSEAQPFVPAEAVHKLVEAMSDIDGESYGRDP